MAHLCTALLRSQSGIAILGPFSSLPTRWHAYGDFLVVDVAENKRNIILIPLEINALRKDREKT